MASLNYTEDMLDYDEMERRSVRITSLDDVQIGMCVWTTRARSGGMPDNCEVYRIFNKTKTYVECIGWRDVKFRLKFEPPRGTINGLVDTYGTLQNKSQRKWFNSVGELGLFEECLALGAEHRAERAALDARHEAAS